MQPARTLSILRLSPAMVLLTAGLSMSAASARDGVDTSNGLSGQPRTQSTKAGKKPPKGNGSKASESTSEAGPFPFIPPLMTTLPTGAQFSLDTKGITLKSADPDVKFRVGGRFQFDGSVADLRPSSLNPALSDNAHVRRAWLESYLTLRDSVEFAFQYDFNDNTHPINDAVVAYRGWQPFIVTLGNIKEPFSLNQLESDTNTLFTERSLLDSFAPGRDFGGTVGTHGANWTAVAGLYGGNANTGIADDGVAGTARLTYAPILTEQQVLHFGVAGSYRSLDSGGTKLSFSSRPEDYLFAKDLVNTGTLRNAADVGRLGLETIYQFGSYRVQAEYALTNVDGMHGQADRLFQAGYVEGAWVINGDGRPYRLVPDYGSGYAVLQGVAVKDGQRISKGGIGVFEIGARYSAISLRDDGTKGGVEQNVTAGINWYPDKNVKVMADYVRAHVDPSATTVAGSAVDSNIFVGRVQFTW